MVKSYPYIEEGGPWGRTTRGLLFQPWEQSNIKYLLGRAVARKGPTKLESGLVGPVASDTRQETKKKKSKHVLTYKESRNRKFFAQILRQSQIRLSHFQALRVPRWSPRLLVSLRGIWGEGGDKKKRLSHVTSSTIMLVASMLLGFHYMSLWVALSLHSFHYILSVVLSLFGFHYILLVASQLPGFHYIHSQGLANHCLAIFVVHCCFVSCFFLSHQEKMKKKKGVIDQYLLPNNNKLQFNQIRMQIIYVPRAKHFQNQD